MTNIYSANCTSYAMQDGNMTASVDVLRNGTVIKTIVFQTNDQTQIPVIAQNQINVFKDVDTAQAYASSTTFPVALAVS